MCAACCLAQSTDRYEQAQVRTDLRDQGLLSATTVTNIGPTIFSGRVVDLDVNPSEPTEFYVAYASGGLWYTNNNGGSFTPVFDHEAVMTIGDIAVHWPSHTIYVGTGEVNSSRSSYAGVGMYKSTDKGQTWQYLGLPESHHIGRVLIHSEDPNKVTVAVLGHLYTANKERGIYHSNDGGVSWSQTLYVNDNAGAVDLVAHPQDANVMYAATWERTRRAWDFTESGAGSGIYKSIDGGTTWQAVGGSGFPTGEGTGRIGLDVTVHEGTTYLYAILDNYNRRPKEDKKEDGLTKDDFADMTAEAFAKLTDEQLDTYLSDNGMKKYSAKAVKKMVASGKIKPVALKEYVEDANRLLFDTPVVGAEVYVSTDEGSNWSKTHEGYLDGVYNSYGYYFGQIRVEPNNPEVLYIMGVPILRSDDGGANWTNINGDNVHVDHHALWINPYNTSHIINGNDGGLNISYDKGQQWTRPASPAVGQFYYVNVDDSEDYKVYGGTQDNGVWVGSSDYKSTTRWQMYGNYPYETIMGGDGMQVQIDSRDNKTVYTGYQFGNYFRIDTETGEREYITPKHKLGDRPYRWNWQSPILLSEHNEDIVYFGANKLLRSMDQGATFEEISHDLTKGGKKGDVAYGTLTTISESPLHFGLIYTGTDDGNIHVTRDGGHSWQLITDGLPADLWVSRVVASAHDTATVYATLNGYRNDHFAAYLYKSSDYGSTWTSLADGLPYEPVNVIKEDPAHADILYVGTDHGTYMTTDGGNSYMAVGGDMPSVPVHDVVVHSGSGDLIIGTHGRSIYKIELEPLRAAVSSGAQLTISGPAEVRHSIRWGSKRRPYEEAYVPTQSLKIFAAKAGKSTLKVSKEGKTIYEESIAVPLGLSALEYDMIANDGGIKALQKLAKKEKASIKVESADDGRYYLTKGEYEVSLTQGTTVAKHTMTIK